MPEQMPRLAQILSRLGVTVTPEALSDPRQPPLAAVVSLGGCSASFVSPEGLIITNHHCVTGALQQNSTPERNLITQGFIARTRQEEVWAGPTSRVYVTQTQSEVSGQVLDGLAAITDAKARFDERERRQTALVAACEKDRPHLRCEVADFDEGARYVLIERLEIKDVRLVYAPHEGIGNFGGEIDNWRWPRHAGDFSFLRAYVGRDGKPADHARNNVPYKPPHHLQIAREPLRPGDFVMVAGYPGDTFRHRTALEVANAVDWYYPWSLGAIEAQLAVLDRVTADKPALQIKAASRVRGLNNALTNFRGTLEGLTKGGLADDKRALERELVACIEGDPARRDRWGDVLPRLNAIQKEKMATQSRDRALRELLRGSSLVAAGLTIVKLVEQRERPDAEREPGFQDRDVPQLAQGMQAMTRTYDPRIDRALFTLAIERGLAWPAADQPKEALQIILGTGQPSAGEIDLRLAKLYGNETLDQEALRVSLVQTATKARLATISTPLLDLAKALHPLKEELERREERLEGEQALLRPAYLDALKACTKGPLAPDANGTLRVTFGTVRGYRPTPDAPVYFPFTTVDQMVEKVAKNDGKAPFNAPANILKAARERRFGAYEDKVAGGLPLDFLSDLDITGGNSGSATLNRHGHLVGLAFDGKYEAIASDWLFIPEITRAIHVDIRYALWTLAEVDRGHHLLREMGVQGEGGTAHSE